MAYVAWSVVFGEQPSAAKWNIIGTNMAGFNDGTAISNLEIGSGHTAVKNDYKFRVYRNAALSTSAGSFIVVTCDTKSFDTGSNVDIVTNKGRFTAPIAGFYQFNGSVGIAASSGTTQIACALYKNGAVVSYGSETGDTASTGAISVTVSDTLQLAANDYVEFEVFCNGATALTVGASSPYFSGFLVSTT